MIEGIWISDLHGGSTGGIMSPDWRRGPSAPEAPLQELFWNWFAEHINEIGPVDYLLNNGDGTDGLIRPAIIDIAYANPESQAQIAADAVSIIKRKHTLLTYGTPAHTVGLHDYENKLAAEMNGEIDEEQTLSIYGRNYHWRHTAGRSDTPYGQGTQLYKQKVLDALQAEAQGYPKADTVARAHVHYYLRYEMAHGEAISQPAMQLPINRYGRKLNTAYYNVGFLHVRHHKGGYLDVYRHILQLSIVKPRRYRCLPEEKRRQGGQSPKSKSARKSSNG